MKIADFSVAEMTLNAACGINNHENFLLKILRSRLFIALKARPYLRCNFRSRSVDRQNPASGR
jgi:hypothetical protein